jgi:hypothetical protein
MAHCPAVAVVVFEDLIRAESKSGRWNTVPENKAERSYMVGAGLRQKRFS